MLSKAEIWERVSVLAQQGGCRVFDIEYPSGPRGVFRVFLCNSEGKTSGVGHEQCAALTRKLCDLEDIEELAPGECSIEVSTPGINRRLSRPEHFVGAIGERVKLVVRGSGSTDAASIDSGTVGSSSVVRGKSVLRGILRSVDDAVVKLEEEQSGSVIEVQREMLREARIDFKF